MLRKSILFAALLFVSPMVLLAQTSTPAQPVGPIVIGQSVPLSGSNKELGEDIRDGALAYLKKINDNGGIHGRKIELISIDDANDTKKSEANTITLIEKHKVLALYGYGSTTLSKPALPHVERTRLPFFAPFTGADFMRKFNRYVYNHRASYADELEEIVEHYSTFGLKRFAVIHHDDAVGKENLGAVERALKSRNLTPVSVASVKRTQKEISTEVAALVAANPEVVIATTLYQTTADFVKMARNQGLESQFVSLSFAGTTALAQALGSAGVGVVMSQVVPTPSRAAIPIVKEYHHAIKEVAPDKRYSFTGLESYIAAKLLVEGIKRAGPSVTRESLLKTLDTLGAVNLGGYVVTFTPNNHNGSEYVGLTVLNRDLAFRD